MTEQQNMKKTSFTINLVNYGLGRLAIIFPPSQMEQGQRLRGKHVRVFIRNHDIKFITRVIKMSYERSVIVLPREYDNDKRLKDKVVDIEIEELE